MLIKVLKLNPKRKVIRIPRIRNGAKGISVLNPTFFLLNIIIARPTIAPIQNARITANTPPDNPSIQPIPIINFTSPNPINLPLENSQIKTNGNAIIGPAKMSRSAAQEKIFPNSNRFEIVTKKDRKINGNTVLFGIILCLKSYTNITINNENRIK